MIRPFRFSNLFSTDLTSYEAHWHFWCLFIFIHHHSYYTILVMVWFRVRLATKITCLDLNGKLYLFDRILWLNRPFGLVVSRS